MKKRRCIPEQGEERKKGKKTRKWRKGESHSTFLKPR